MSQLKFSSEMIIMATQDYHVVMEAQMFSRKLQLSSTFTKLFHLEQFAICDITFVLYNILGTTEMKLIKATMNFKNHSWII